MRARDLKRGMRVWMPDEGADDGRVAVVVREVLDEGRTSQVLITHARWVGKREVLGSSVLPADSEVFAPPPVSEHPATVLVRVVWSSMNNCGMSRGQRNVVIQGAVNELLLEQEKAHGQRGFDYSPYEAAFEELAELVKEGD